MVFSKTLSLFNKSEIMSLLQVGDVIHLKTGMTVYGQLVEMFIYANRKPSKKLTTNAEVIVGKLYQNEKDLSYDIDTLSGKIFNDFKSLGFEVSLAKAKEFILSNIPPVEDETYMLEEGEFLVYKTNNEGGSASCAHDWYPDGHRVYCVRLKDGQFDPLGGQEVNFYQTGSFTAMIKDITPVRTLKPSFV